MLAQFLLVLILGPLGLHQAPQLVDRLLQVALVQVGDCSEENGIQVVGLHVVQHFSEQFDSFIEVFGFDFLTSSVD